MTDLLMATLEMMGLTFAIGFLVAFIIKIIANGADSFDFYHSHQQGLLRLRRLKEVHKKLGLMISKTFPGEENINDQREDFSKGINREAETYSRQYSRDSSDMSEPSLFDFYYSKEDPRQQKKNGTLIAKETC